MRPPNLPPNASRCVANRRAASRGCGQAAPHTVVAAGWGPSHVSGRLVRGLVVQRCPYRPPQRLAHHLLLPATGRGLSSIRFMTSAATDSRHPQIRDMNAKLLAAPHLPARHGSSTQVSRAGAAVKVPSLAVVDTALAGRAVPKLPQSRRISLVARPLGVTSSLRMI
jgi:hypothetical protein